jgi:hypothetical protein
MSTGDGRKGGTRYVNADSQLSTFGRLDDQMEMTDPSSLEPDTFQYLYEV